MSLQGELHGRLRLIFDSPDMETARRLLNETIEVFSARAHKAVERCWKPVLRTQWPLKKLYQGATGSGYGRPMEPARLNQEVRRRGRVIRIFPNEESALRLIGAVLVEIDEAWSCGTRYFDMAEYWERKSSKEKQRNEVGNADICTNAA